MSSPVLSLIISVGGNLSLAFLFARALLFPLEHLEFVLNTGMLLFLIEFLGIHSSGMAMGIANQEKEPKERDPRIIFSSSVKGFGAQGSRALGPSQTKIVLIAVYAIFTVAFGLVLKNAVLPLVFFVGLIAKFFGQRLSGAEHPGRVERFGISVVLLIFLAFFVTIFSPFLAMLFPFPSEVRPSGSGSWVDFPQSPIVWGALYYFSLAVIDAAFYLKRENTLVWKPFYYASTILLGIMSFLTSFFAKKHPDSKESANMAKLAERLGRTKAGGFEEFLKSVSSQKSPPNTPP